ncbi:hypothetical protein RIF29_34425 [Crotalaria pallida]|uniref:Uncharacterized protein n=1 Tax=Crotalaria pallida TaxID=3830 RepID=A0AAN9HTI9_CROPI
MMSIVATAADLMHDFMTGYLTLASAKSMFKVNRKDAEDCAGAIASGLICDDGIWTIPCAVLSILRIDPPICMHFRPSASS